MLKNWILNIALAIAAGLLLLWLIFLGLNLYTRHNDSIDVPNIKGQSYDIAAEKLEDAGLRFEIYDSVYNEDFKKDAITEQDPKAGSKVKPGRIIYLSINALGKPMIKVPKLTDQSFALSKLMLKNAGFELGDVEFRYDDIGNNLVIEQLYKGANVNPGKMLVKGSIIDLVVATDRRNSGSLDSTGDNSEPTAPILDGIGE